MPDGLQTARQLAEDVRFSGDELRQTTDGETTRTRAIADTFFRNELEISEAVTPALAANLELVCNRLKLSKDAIHAFVYASPEIQAECYSASSSLCVLRFSSGLVDLLDAEEFSFVCGHELGHFLMGHGLACMEHGNGSIEFMMQKRAQEISVDRLGLITCGSMDIAIRALMKTASGLNSEHLRFDVSAYIAQLQKSSHLTNSAEYATHPSIIVRCRALLWFSLNDYFTKGTEVLNRSQLEKLDSRIEGDLSAYVDGPARQTIDEAKDDLALWMAVHEIVQNGRFEKQEQAAIAKMFGSAILEKLISFLRDIPASEMCETVLKRVENARNSLEGIIPTGFDEELREIERRISSSFAVDSGVGPP